MRIPLDRKYDNNNDKNLAVKNRFFFAMTLCVAEVGHYGDLRLSAVSVRKASNLRNVKYTVFRIIMSVLN